MDYGDDRTVIVEEKVDLNEVFRSVLDRYLDTTRAMFDFLSSASRDLGRGHVALASSFIKGSERRWKFFERQARLYQGALLRKDLFSLKRRTPEDRVAQMKQALALAMEDVQVVQAAEMAAIEELGEQILRRHVQLLEIAQRLLQRPGASRLTVREVRMFAEACQHEWGANRSGSDGGGD